MSTAAVPDTAADLMADDTDTRHRNERAEVANLIGGTLSNLPPADGAPHTADTPEADRAAELVTAANPYLTALVDLRDLLKAGPPDADWLIEPVIAAGRAVALVAKKKQGKSLLMLVIIGAACTGRDPFTGDRREPIKVLYVDHEMSTDDVYERLVSMGYDSDDDLDALAENLKYSLLPMSRPLDTAEGGALLLEAVDELAPDLVVIDTLSRVTEGDENDARTIQNYYQHTGQHLKRRGIAVARLDHMGKDSDRGARGSSAKGDDVDVVWHQTATNEGWKLKREAARMGWVPDEVNITKSGGDPLTVRLADESWPKGTTEQAADLDAIGWPVEARNGTGRGPARAALKAAGYTVDDDRVLGKALKYRRRADYGTAKALDDLI